MQFLSKYGLYKNGDFTNAAVILFGNKPVTFFPQVRVRLTVFQNTKEDGNLLYDKIFDHNLFKSIRNITDFFDLALLQTSVLQEKTVAVFAQSPARLNSDITVVGYPLSGLLGGLNVTRGSVSSLKGLRGDGVQMQISAPVQPGNSGGPVVSGSGAIVGVVVSKLNARRVADETGDIPQNVNFAKATLIVIPLVIYAGYASFTDSPRFPVAKGSFQEKYPESSQMDSDELGGFIFTTLCTKCHGPNGKKGRFGAADLSISKYGIEEKMEMITKGSPLTVMRSFSNELSEDEIRSVATYVDGLKK